MHPKYLRQITVKANTIKISSEIIPVDWPRDYRRWLKGSPQRVAAEYSGIIVQRNFDANTLVNENIEREISVRENNVSNGMIRSKGIILGALTISENQAALCRWSKNIRSNENNRCVTQEFESP